MWGGRLLRACVVALAFSVAAGTSRPAQAQANFDRPGSDYQSSTLASGDPAECALVCERDRRCRAWSFNYPTDIAGGAVCWLKNSVPARVRDDCCISGVRGAGVVEPRNGAVETSIDRAGGDYRNFGLKSGEGDEGLQGGLHRGQQMPGLDLCAAGICRQGSALFPEKGNKAAAAQARIYLGRGAVTLPTSVRNRDARRKRSCLIEQGSGPPVDQGADNDVDAESF